MTRRMRLAGARTFSSLRVRNYRLFAAGQLLSLTGTWMQIVAQGWLVLDLTGSGVALGVTVALEFLPVLLFGLWGGLVADRFDKRKVLLATQTSSAVLALTLWALVASGSVTLWAVYVVVFLSGCVHLVDMPTRQTFVTEMVGPEAIPNAVALNSAMFNTGRLVGPALAGIVIAWAGVAPAFFVNAVSYLGVIAALAFIRPEELFHQPRAVRESRQVRAGLRYVWETPALRTPLLLVAAVGTFGMNFVVVLPLLARFDLEGGARMYGAFTSAMAVGALGGALVMAARGRPTRRRLVGSAAAFGALTIGTGLAPDPVTVGVLLVGVGAASIVLLATANATLQLSSDPAHRGRVMALYGLVFLGSTPVGGPLMGWISQHWGPRAALELGGVISLAAAVALPAVALRRRRHETAASADDDLSAGMTAAA